MPTNQDKNVVVRFVLTDYDDRCVRTTYAHKMFLPEQGDKLDLQKADGSWGKFLVANSIAHYFEDDCDYTFFLQETSLGD